MTAENEALLRESPMLHGLGDELLTLLARAASRVELPPASVIVREGEVGSGLHMVVAGEVVVVAGAGRHRDLVRRAGRGVMFGLGALTDEPEAASFETAGPLVTLTWDRDAITAMTTGLDGQRLCQQLARRLSIVPRRSELLALLDSSALFRGTGAQLQAWLLDSATLIPCWRGETIMREGDEGDFMAIVVRGEFGVLQGERPEPIHVLRRSEGFGELALLEHKPRNATIRALGDGELLIIERQPFEALLRDAPAFRRAIRAIAGERIIEREDRQLDTVVMVNDTDYDATTIALLVGQYLGEGFGDRVLVATVEREVRPTTVLSDTLLHCSLSSDSTDLSALPHRDQLDLAIITFTPETRDRAPGYLASASTIIYLSDSVEHPFPYPQATRRQVRHIAVGPALARGFGRRGSIQIDFGVRPNALGPDLTTLGSLARQAVGRLARAIVQREVGVALGGGAGWGWAHLPLLWGLHERGIPIDMVAGVSFGAFVGACYASMGLRGLDELLAYRTALSLSPPISALTMWPWGRLVRHIVPHRLLEQLPTPLFVLATDILSGRPKVFRQGDLAEAVRASCTLPGWAGTTVFDGRRYVDGCVVDNVPVGCLREEGTDFVIASNVIPKPSALAPQPHETALQRLRFAYSPLHRVRDGIRSFFLQSHLLGDRSFCADVQFQPDLSSVPIPNYSAADKVIELARRDLDVVLDEIVTRYKALGGARARSDSAISFNAPDVERVPEGKPGWERRPEIRADGPPPLILKGYLGGIRLAAKYFRYECEGYEHILASPSSLIVGYHGRPFAWDQGMLAARMYDELGYYPRTFSSKGLLDIPVYREIADSYGAIYEWPSEQEIERIKAAGHHLAVFPGGMREAVRPFWIRYQLDFGPRRGYLRLANHFNLPLIPVVATGVDDAYLGLNDGYAMSKRLTGTSYYSLWLGLGLVGFYPLALPFPVKIRQRIGPPIDLGSLREAAGSEEEFLELAHTHVTTTMQRMLDELRNR